MNDIDRQWAWSQVEAMADGALPHADETRMRAALRADARLREAVERAVAVRNGLRGLGRADVPASLWRRLLQIPRASRRVEWQRSPRLIAAAGLAAASIVAVVASAMFLELARTPPPPSPDERAAAVADFAVAMTYLQRTATLANTEMTAAVRDGLQDALAVGRNAARDGQPEPSNGD